MAHGWDGDADCDHGCAGRGLHPNFLYRLLGLELADMTQEDIIRMAREANASFETAESMFKFAALVADAEREACAKLVDHILKEGGGTWGDAIRARGQA
jgi:hypothetical protein